MSPPVATRAAAAAEQPPQDRRDPMNTAKMRNGSELLIGLRAARASGGPARRQRLAIDDADHLIEPGVDAAVEITLAEQRRDGFRDDAAGGGVR